MKIKWPILLIVMMFFSCVWLDDKLGDDPLELVFTILPQLNQNGDGYYVLPINSEGKQITNHTVYTYVGARDYNELEYIHSENKTVHWLSNLFWVMDDTLGYYRKRIRFEQDYRYITSDTSFIYSGDTTAFQKTVGCCSTSDEDGIGSTILTVLSSMLGDTIVLEAGTFDEYDNFPEDTLYISVPIIITK